MTWRRVTAKAPSSPWPVVSLIWGAVLCFSFVVPAVGLGIVLVQSTNGTFFWSVLASCAPLSLHYLRRKIREGEFPWGSPELSLLPPRPGAGRSSIRALADGCGAPVRAQGTRPGC